MIISHLTYCLTSCSHSNKSTLEPKYTHTLAERHSEELRAWDHFKDSELGNLDQLCSHICHPWKYIAGFVPYSNALFIRGDAQLRVHEVPQEGTCIHPHVFSVSAQMFCCQCSFYTLSGLIMGTHIQAKLSSSEEIDALDLQFTNACYIISCVCV